MTTTVKSACDQLRVALDILSSRDASEFVRRKDVVKLILDPLFNERTDENDAVFVAMFNPLTGVTTISSTEHPDCANFRMHKISRRKLEHFIRTLELVKGYVEVEVDKGVYVIADRGNLYIMRESLSACWRMDPMMLIRAMEESVSYYSAL
jgi:hypothetical protein